MIILVPDSFTQGVIPIDRFQETAVFVVGRQTHCLFGSQTIARLDDFCALYRGGDVGVQLLVGTLRSLPKSNVEGSGVGGARCCRCDGTAGIDPFATQETREEEGKPEFVRVECFTGFLF